MLRKILLLSTVAILSFAIVACSGNAEPEEVDFTPATGDDANVVDGEAVAIVNGQEISVEEFNGMMGSMKAMYAQSGFDFEDEEAIGMLQELEQQVLNNLISMEVLRQEAEGNGYEVTEEEIDVEIDQLKVQFGTDEEFAEVLAANSMTLEQLRNSIGNEILIDRFVENEMPQPSVTEEEALVLYEEYSMMQEDMPAFEEVRDMIEDELRQQKLDQQIGQVIQTLVEESDIEILI
ncbi:SurA N-terminal domain-containing protein [Desulfuribacillus alkaliarsenatis]|uniref:Peptidylprolyl isomerase n=1 Tax=Desulfuribacillus alkaliarsenatis TaxID=766136 RepID=A0A1E5G3L4_9FIRM|nr:SurA N-terminal domain-containing protein [Desulfuribacillus alkaliarsenatis]OEF97679.1 hypothetical protein BHF68_14350 [Desulfuribacillus alkaliarsenatis]